LVYQVVIILYMVRTYLLFVSIVHFLVATCWLWAKAHRGWSYVYSRRL